MHICILLLYRPNKDSSPVGNLQDNVPQNEIENEMDNLKKEDKKEEKKMCELE